MSAFAAARRICSVCPALACLVALWLLSPPTALAQGEGSQPPAATQTDSSAARTPAPASSASSSPAASSAPLETTKTPGEAAQKPTAATAQTPSATPPQAAVAQAEGTPAAPVVTGSTPWYLVVLGAMLLIAVPAVLANYISRAVKMPDHAFRMFLILFSIVASLTVCLARWPPKLGIDLSGGSILVYEVDPTTIQSGVEIQMDDLIAAINRRINPGGVKEVAVRQYGAQQVEVIIPRADPADLERIKNKISSSGLLEFRILANRRDHADIIARALELPPETRELTRKGPDGQIVSVARFVPVVKKAEAEYRGNPQYAVRENKKGEVEALVVTDPERDPYHVTGGELVSAVANTDQRGRPCVNFHFNSRGANLFRGLTGSNLPETSPQEFYRHLGIILDQFLYSAPRIQSAISDSGEITGNFTQAETEDLAEVLTAGRLPAALRKQPSSALITGPTLGADTIRKGVQAMVISTVAVIVFMIVYYRFAGFVANFALLLNVLLTVAFMILFNAAFTLSGLAGLALTVGMAVDANVLIYERMREELSRGATLRMAIRNGFDRATVTIIDSNVTTLISAVVLYAIGSDQVRGFAVTLILGILMNLFTAITCSRVIFEVAERMRWIRSLRMLQILSHTNLDFIGKWKIAVTASVLMVVGGLVACVFRGGGLFDIDFTGGVSVEALFNEPQDISAVRSAVNNLPDVAVSDVQISGEKRGLRFLINTSEQNAKKLEDDLRSIFGGKLAHNNMKFSEPQAIPLTSGVLSPTAQPDVKPSPPPANPGAFAPDWRETLLARADAGAQPPPQSPASSPANGPQPPADGPALPAPAAADQGGTATQASKEAAATAPAVPGPQPPAPSSESTQPAAATADAVQPSPKVDPFAGGSEVVLSFSKGVGIAHEDLRDLINAAFEAPGAVEDRVPFRLDNKDYDIGSDASYESWTLQIALPPERAKPLLEKIQARLAERPYFPSSNTIGGSVVGKTQQQALYAMVASLALTLAYIWVRFSQVSFGFAAVLAVIHDALVALGAIAVSLYLAPYLGFALVEPFKISLPIVAAFLTLIGYSLNDTIVILDRIRELRGKSPEVSSELVNRCVNQTLSRTILTSLTVFVVVVILYVWGGQAIHGFAFTLLVGVISGTYSTIYIATPFVVWMNRQPKVGQTKIKPTGKDLVQSSPSR